MPPSEDRYTFMRPAVPARAIDASTSVGVEGARANSILPVDAPPGSGGISTATVAMTDTGAGISDGSNDVGGRERIDDDVSSDTIDRFAQTDAANAHFAHAGTDERERC